MEVGESNIALHVVVYAMDLEWYVQRLGGVVPLVDNEVNIGFMKAI